MPSQGAYEWDAKGSDERRLPVLPSTGRKCEPSIVGGKILMLYYSVEWGRGKCGWGRRRSEEETDFKTIIIEQAG